MSSFQYLDSYLAIASGATSRSPTDLLRSLLTVIHKGTLKVRACLPQEVSIFIVLTHHYHFLRAELHILLILENGLLCLLTFGAVHKSESTSRDRHTLCFYQHSTHSCKYVLSMVILCLTDKLNSRLRQDSTVRMSTSNDSDTASNWEDVQENLSLPAWPPLEVQPILVTLQHLLLTNNPPSSQDSVVVSVCVSIIDDLIAKSDIAIALITSTGMPGKQSTPLDEQRTQRTDLQHLRKQVHSISSLVRRLPQEIWQEIFFFVHPSEHEDKLNVFNRRSPLYVVGQVCRTWRTASHRHPRLWSELLIVTEDARSQRVGLLRLRTVLERAVDEE